MRLIKQLLLVLLGTTLLWSCSSKPRYYVFKTMRYSPSAKKEKAFAIADTLGTSAVTVAPEVVLAENAFKKKEQAKRAKQLRKLERRIRIAQRIAKFMPKPERSNAEAWVQANANTRRMVLSDSTDRIRTDGGGTCWTCWMCEPLKQFRAAKNWFNRSKPRPATHKSGIAGCFSAMANVLYAIVYPIIFVVYLCLIIALAIEITAIVGALSLLAFALIYALLLALGTPAALLWSLLLAIPLALTYYLLRCSR
jgi:hypothetical protein